MNKLWESSRMFLPEHREKYLQHHHSLKKRSRPVLDDQQHEQNIRALAVALFTEKETIVTVWSDYEDQKIQGRINKFDKERKWIKIENDNEYCWVDFCDVLSIEILLDS